MDKTIRLKQYYFTETKRNLKMTPPVTRVGFMPAKTLWHKQRFPETIAFSLILKGTGQYKRFGKTWEVQAPCVITQWPGDIIEYGPNSTWSEVFITYKEELFKDFIGKGYMNLKKPVWPIHDPSFINIQIKLLTELLDSSPNKELIADTVDHLCLTIIANTVSARRNQDVTRDELKIYELKRQIEENPGNDWDVKKMANFCHMSEATFNRR